ncbi:UPF0182 family protein [Nocardioides euryhalodurans]|uniref:UPF0182 family protein n=1 Tax=Nocardioides euryhalodurans TaxID=2518370 RepID=UPI00142250CA|nr:UPF0182 family protein [Nocardioides euryhalodurans]
MSRQGLDDFLSEYGRLDGRRRPARSPSVPAEASFDALLRPAAPDPRPFILRPRGRATVVVVLLGLPMVAAYVAARILPGALWFAELDRTSVYGRTVGAKLELSLAVAGLTALVVGVNLAVSVGWTALRRPRARVLSVLVASLVIGSLFASSAPQHWQTYLLWRHQQSFGEVDPIHDRDVGFFVFRLPFELLASSMSMALVLVSAVLVTIVRSVRGDLRIRPFRATFGTQCHLAVLAAGFLGLAAWRLRLEQYRLELGQPSPEDPGSFAGAGYVDVHVHSPGLSWMVVFALLLAVACLAAPFVGRGGSRRATAMLVVPGLLLGATALLSGAVVPAVVRQFVVDPNPLLSEGPFVARSITGTRSGLGLHTIEVEPYRPTGSFAAADFPEILERFATVPLWDSWVLEARMQQLVNDTPYYRPGPATLDVPRIDGRRRLTVVSARQLDLERVAGQAQTWGNNRLAFTHGLGLVRFSGSHLDANRQPRLLDAGLGLRQPRIYFGDFAAPPANVPAHDSAIVASIKDPTLAESPWVLVDTRRPEVDAPVAHGAARATYHYDGPAGIGLPGWARRAVFALALGSADLLLSDDITPESRLLLHRDVHDRLDALAPFIQWDSEAVPLTSKGRIVFVVEGYTTSQHFPYAEQVDLAGSPVSYARASVRATVDAFSGEVDLYLTDGEEPVARAWSEVFPDLFRPVDEMPAALRHRVRYPADLFAAQATAYERYHAVRPDQFVSGADHWARPIALSGPIEVAGDVDFDEDDEDDLRLTLQPGYYYGRPPGEEARRLVLRTYYTPRSGQNLVSSLNGWVDDEGDVRLAALDLPRDPVVLGPAQMSRLTFATPRVRNLLGLRNLEIRDLALSSLDTVLLGRPRVLFLPGGPVQIQSLYEGSKGPGAARLIGVTAFLDGRVGLGPDIESALRQALNEPPSVEVRRPREPAVVGEPVAIAYVVDNAKRHEVTITSGAGRQVVRSDLTSGREVVEWVPTAAGDVTVRVEVTGLDGTSVSGRTSLTVLDLPPRIRLIEPPDRLEVGRRVRVWFEVVNGRSVSARLSTRSGIVLDREYLLRDGRAVISWTPQSAGRATLLIRARGGQRQVAETRLRLTVQRRPPEEPPPSVELLRVPERLRVGSAAEFTVRGEDCRRVITRIESADGETWTWESACPVDRATIRWSPPASGRYLLTTTAVGDASSAQATTTLRVTGQ